MLLVTLPPTLIYWTKVLSRFISIQLVVQALSVASGILLVRTLDQQQYAYFTIANTMQATMNMLSDVGVGISLSAIGGKVWQDRYRFGQLINTALQLRYSLAVISITLVTPILIWMLIRNGASIGYTVLITVVVLAGLNFQLTAGVLIVVPRLYSQINRVQNLDLLSGISRLILLGIGYLTFWNAGVAIASASLVAGLQRFILGCWASENIDRKTPINKEDYSFILATLKNTLPTTIFFCLQGQLSLLLISIFGSTQNVAEVGALGRLGVIFSIINSVMTTIVLPSFSRCQSVDILCKRYFQVLSLFAFIGVFMIIISLIFPSELLWILGEKYNHLKNELVLMVTLTSITSFVGVMCSLNLSKAWVQYSWIEIPIRLVFQSALLMVLDVSNVKGVIIFSLLSEIPPFLVNAMLTYRGLMTYKTT